jgi:hypothetical protein
LLKETRANSATSNARAVLGGLERRTELVKAGVMTAAEDAIADYQAEPLSIHIAAFIDSLKGRETSSVRVANMEAQFLRVSTDCGFLRLSDLNETALTAWLRQQGPRAEGAEGMSAATRNEYRKAFNGFCNWCLRTHRMSKQKTRWHLMPTGLIRVFLSGRSRIRTCDPYHVKVVL